MSYYKELKVWQMAMQLVLEVYKHTRQFPRDELYGLTAQMRRASVSVPSNIAEGKGRHSHKDLVHFLFQARGSLLELETQAIIARDLGYLEHEPFHTLQTKTEEVRRTLNGLIAKFQESVPST